MKLLKSLNKIWDEIKHGENIDSYITIFVALILTLVNILGFPTDSYLPTITLAILALLAISNLGNRHRLESLINKKSAHEVLLQKFPENIDESIIEAEEVMLIGVNLRRTIFRLTTEINKKLYAGHKIKVLLVNPDGIGNSSANFRLFARKEDDRITDEEHGKVIRMVLEHLDSKKKKMANVNLEIKTINYPIHFGAVVTNINSSKAKIYIEQYGFRMEQDDLPKMVLTYDDEFWFEHYKSQISTLWDNASNWES